MGSARANNGVQIVEQTEPSLMRDARIMEQGKRRAALTG